MPIDNIATIATVTLQLELSLAKYERIYENKLCVCPKQSDQLLVEQCLLIDYQLGVMD